MKLFIDTANLDEIKEAKSYGVLDGVTTNPTLLAKEGQEPTSQLAAICKVTKTPVSAEVTASNFEEMIDEAKELAKIAKNIVIKVPCTIDGLKAAKELAWSLQIPTNLTLCFSPLQALLVAKAGADYVSPFVGRLDDIATPGMNLIREVKTIFDAYELSTEIIVASIRHPIHVLEAAKIGAHIATVPFNVIAKLMKHPLTDIGLERFAADWEKLQQELGK